MSQEKNKTHHDDAPVVDRVYSEATPFEPGYQPESLPKVDVPDLPDDALSLSAQALAQVPTLTESVSDTPAIDRGANSLTEVVQASSDVTVSADVEAPIQDIPPQADLRSEELQVRMEKLSGEIQTLNARLDRLERRNKTKV